MALGWSITVYRGGHVENVGAGEFFIPVVVDGVTLHHTSLITESRVISSLLSVAVEIVNNNGFPCLYKVHACDVPYTLTDIPDDEILFVEAWDQS